MLQSSFALISWLLLTSLSLVLVGCTTPSSTGTIDSMAGSITEGTTGEVEIAPSDETSDTHADAENTMKSLRLLTP